MCRFIVLYLIILKLKEALLRHLSQTDDPLPFQNSLITEYAMLLAQPPLGLGLTEDEIRRIAAMSMECRFPRTEVDDVE